MKMKKCELDREKCLLFIFFFSVLLEGLKKWFSRVSVDVGSVQVHYEFLCVGRTKNLVFQNENVPYGPSL